MPTQPQRLLQLSTELQRLEPWFHVGERSVFLVRVPGHGLPFAVTVFGDTVSVMGIEVSLEPDGFRRLAKLHDPESSDDEIEAFKPGRALSLVFLPKGQVPPDFRRVWKAAAFRPSGSQPAPQFAATDGGDAIRPIKRSEGTVLGYCTHALIDALSRDRLYPPDLADGEEATLLLFVPGDDPGAFEDEALPEVKIDVVAWPDASGVLPPARVPCEAVKAGVEALEPGVGFRMISAFESSGADAAGVPTGSHVMLLFDPASQELVASVHTESADPEALESGLLRLLQAHGERPDGLIMENARLALVAFPFCRALGIEPLMDEFGGDLAHLIDDATCDRGGTPPGRLADMIDALQAIGGETAPAAFPDRLESAEDWEAALRYTSASLLIDAQQTGALAEATQRYWGGARHQARIMELMSSLGAMQAFIGYALEDHVFSENGTTVLDDYLREMREAAEISDAEIGVLEARRNVIVSLFELSEDASTATDLIDGMSFSVDIDLDNSARFGGHVMLMRRYEVAGHQAFSMAGFPSPAAERDEQISRATEALGAGPTHDLLRSKGAALGSTWQHWVTRIIDATRGAGPRARPVSRDR